MITDVTNAIPSEQPQQINAIITVEQYEWLRRAAFQHRVSQSQIVREALDLWRREHPEAA